MFEKVNPSHPDKVADRIAGALVDMAYGIEQDPRIAVEVLIGHGSCRIIAETSVSLDPGRVLGAVERIAGTGIETLYTEVPQDPILAGNQEGGVRCGDNGIFRGCPVSDEQLWLSRFMRELYVRFPTDGKAVVCDNELMLCQSEAADDALKEIARMLGYTCRAVNPLGFWTGGVDVDSGATNRKLGSDMGDAVTGGGLHGKDLSKADVSVNIYAHLLAQRTGKRVELCCAIGDASIGGVPYREIVERARDYVRSIGGFEMLAEWGLV